MSPLAVDPRDQLFRTMLALSVGFHVVLLLVSVLWTGLSKPSRQFVPVAVVDLVGGLGPEPRPAAPEARPAAAREPSRGKAPAVPRAKAAREPAAKPERIAKAERVAKKEAPTAPRAAPPDTSGLSDKIRKMREAKRSEENVQEALGTLRREKEARAAVRKVGERVAHRIDLSSVRPAPSGKTPPASGSALGGAAGTVRVPPEQLAYLNTLKEKVTSSWIRAERAGVVGKPVIVRITIEKDGRVTNVITEESSGNRFFDDSVLRAIVKASPLPVPPVALRGAEDHYVVGFRFQDPGEGR